MSRNDQIFRNIWLMQSKSQCKRCMQQLQCSKPYKSALKAAYISNQCSHQKIFIRHVEEERYALVSNEREEMACCLRHLFGLKRQLLEDVTVSFKGLRCPCSWILRPCCQLSQLVGIVFLVARRSQVITSQGIIC